MPEYHPDQNPYQSPPPHQQPYPIPSKPGKKPFNPNPSVLTWQVVYMICHAMIGIAMSLFGGYIAANPEQLADPDMTPDEAMLMGYFYLVWGIFTIIIHAIGLMFRRGSAAWVYNIVVFSFGCLCGCLPASVTILVFWIQAKDAIAGPQP